MSELTHIKIDLKGLGGLLAADNWAVPRYQRAYKWEEKQVTDLLSDVESAIAEKEAEYFVGSIVAARTSGAVRPEIVDGQQRLATVSILISAIRDFFFEDADDKQGAAIIQSKFLFELDLKSRDVLPKLKLSDADNDFFLKRILEAPSAQRKTVKIERESHNRLVEAQEAARKYVLRVTEKQRSPRDRLQERLDYFAQNARVILVEVPSFQNAFTVFETLNYRGIDLAIADLLKNYLFHRSENRTDEVQLRWWEMFVTVEAAAGEEAVKDYIRHQWSSQHGLTRERDLYDEIKGKITTKRAAVDYATELAVDARLFSALQNSSHEFWARYGTATRQHVSLIKNLGMERITPLLLAVLGAFSKNDIQLSLKMIVRWGVRLLVAGGVAGALERKYSDTAVKIRKGSIKTPASLFTALRSEIPSDSDFRAAFAVAKVPRAPIARYYLQVLEKQIRGEAEPELVPNPDEQQINLEHVLPQNPRAGTWMRFGDEDRKSYTQRLGNLALSKRSENSGSGNDEFLSKRDNYKKSSLRLTQQIGSVSDWTVAAIEERQRQFAQLAVKAWPLR